MLTLLKDLTFNPGFITQTDFSPSTWLFLARNNQLFAIDATQQELRFTLDLPGSSSHSKILIVGDSVVVSRYRENTYDILAYSLVDGRELWRTTLPLTLNAIYEGFLAHQAAALTIIIFDQAFRLDPVNGNLLAHITLPEQVSQIAQPTTTDRLYIRCRTSFGYLTPDLQITTLLQQSLLEIAVHQDHLYLLPRRDSYIAVWSATQASETQRIKTDTLKINVRSITPLPQNPNHLALRLKNADVAAVLDLPTGSLVWKSRLKAKYLKIEDGFGPYLLTSVENGLVITLWSVGSDEEMSTLCDPTTGRELFSFGLDKIRHASVSGYHLTYNTSGIQIYTRSDTPHTSTGYLTLK